MTTSIADHVARVRERIAAVCGRIGREAGEISIIGASKSFSALAIAEAFSAGITDFGENYLQEALRKRPGCPPEIVWHFIGRVQSNKAAGIGQSFAWVQTVDRADKAGLLARGALRAASSEASPTRSESSGEGPSAVAAPLLNVLIEVNIAREPQKGGVFPEGLDKLAETVYSLPGVRLRGLMTMGPLNLEPGAIRPYFSEMRGLLEGLRIPGADCLSMGMSADFEVAVEEGATHVRIGSGIFGPRRVAGQGLATSHNRNTGQT